VDCFTDAGLHQSVDPKVGPDASSHGGNTHPLRPLQELAADAPPACPAAPAERQPTTPPPPGLLPRHWAELQDSAIAPDVARANVASFGPGTPRHWEAERAELVAHARRQIQTASTTASGRPQAQPGHLADRLIALDRRYRHLAAGGWRSLSAELEGVPRFDQWKPDQARARADRPGRSIKYEAPPQAPDGGGLLLPTVPERCWRLICERHGLPLPDAATLAAGFWPWALTTPALPLLICEGWKKALAAVSAGHAALALPGVQMGRRVGADGAERLIPALQLLAAPARPWLIAFDAEARPDTARKVGAAAGALARTLRAAGGRPVLARLPLLPSAEKTGLDDLLAAAGPEALDRALSDTGPRPVLPALRPADRLAPAGQWLGVACPLPTPEAAPLLLLQAAMGSGKTQAIAAAAAPLLADGVPLLLPSHRVALGQALAERLGVAWAPLPDTDARQLGAGFCLDSACPSSGLQITGHGWSGALLVWDEIAQGLEHLLLSSGTALADRRGEVLRTLAELLARSSQIIAADAQLSGWALRLLEQLSGRRGLLIRSEHRPMAGRQLHAPSFQTAADAADGFRAQWAELLEAGAPFLCWSSAQQAGMRNAPQTLAALHRQRYPDARVAVIDSTTPEAAAELAADPDGYAARFDALYVSPAISSGLSFQRWRPAAVLAYAGGRVAPEHAAQALARVRCPDVPAYLFAPERCPGAALRVGSGATDPAQLIADLRAVADPLLGQLEQEAADGAWLEAWAELGAHRNRQRYAYAASICGLLQAEGWELQAEGPAPCPAAGAQAAADLRDIAEAAQLAADQAVIDAELLEPQAAAALQRRRQLEPDERAALARFRLAERWALGDAAPSLELLEADRDGLADRLQLGWLLTTPEAAALVPERDAAAVAALDQAGRPFAPDRLRVALAPRLAALQALGVPELLERFAAGETIAATDPAVLALHTAATAHRGQLAAAAGLSPRKLPTGTLRALLQACGWELVSAGRIKARGDGRDAYIYRAQRLALPEGVEAQALAARWLADLQDAARKAGAKTPPTQKPCRGEKSPTPPPSGPPPHRHRWPLAPVPLIPWASAPPPPRSAAPVAA